MRLIGRPESRTSTNHTPAKRIVEPKSGWAISSTATRPMTQVVTATTGSLGSRTRHDRTQARAMAKAGLRNSDGWSDTPRFSHRRAPFTSLPIAGTRISATSMAEPSRMPARRARSFGRNEAPIIVIKPRICQRTWSTKKCRSSSLTAAVERRRALAGEAAATATVPIAIRVSTRASSTRSISRHQTPISARRPRRNCRLVPVVRSAPGT